MKELKKRIEKYNKIFENGEKFKKGKSFEIIEGEIPILISAPHSVSQIREGKIKVQEYYTGPMVIELANQTKCFAIYKTFNNNDDASYDINNNSYKETALKLIKDNQIKLFIDIHGAKNREEFDIDIGTDGNSNLNERVDILEELIRYFNINGISKVGVNSKFKADSFHTITKTVAVKAKIPSMQIEITKRYREIEDFEKMKLVIDTLIKFMQDINI